MLLARLFTARGLRAGVLALAALLLAGCATGPNPRDPLEPYNRRVMQFNDDLDQAVLKPVAVAYRDVVPRPVRTGVGNVLGNVTDVWSFFNSVLQLKLRQSAEVGLRVTLNTLFGLGGLLDVATELGLERHSEDFGQTLGRWGVPPGPYVVMPFLGPSTLRDATATITLDRLMDPLFYIDHQTTRWSVFGLRLVNTRADLLRVSNVLDEVALDRYTFARDAFLQKRSAEIRHGRPAAPLPTDEFDYREPPPAVPAAPPAPALPGDAPPGGPRTEAPAPAGTGPVDAATASAFAGDPVLQPAPVEGARLQDNPGSGLAAQPPVDPGPVIPAVDRSGMPSS